MRLILFLALFLLPAITQAQTDQGQNENDCLAEGKIGHIVGNLAYGSFRHPFRNIVIDGYKITLIEPRCFDYTNPNSGKRERTEITEVQIYWGGGLLIKRNIGRKITTTGLMDNYDINTIAWPQIYADQAALCENSSKTCSVGKDH